MCMIVYYNELCESVPHTCEMCHANGDEGGVWC